MRQRILIIVGFIVAVAVVAALINGFVQDTIYPVVAEAYVLLRTIVTAFQSLVWLALVFIGLNLAIQSLMAGRQKRTRKVEEKRQFIGRLETLANQVRRVDEEDFYRWRVARHVTGLARQALGHSHTLSREELEAVLDDEFSEVPPDVARFLREGVSPRAGELPILTWEQRLREFAYRYLPQRTGRYSAEPALIQTIEFLEAELEVNRDRY
jgi:hypothetical protein